ncbi:MAG: TRM11 family methyltransferase [Saprospiraceae bacterium]
MPIPKHIYCFRYETYEEALCKLESKYIFEEENANKVLFTDVKVEPSSSAFIKTRLDIIKSSNDYPTLIKEIKSEEIHLDGFKVEYVVFDGDTTEYPERLEKLKDIGFSIDGTPNYYKPTVTYALCIHEGIWYFGTLIKNHYAWEKHNKKPFSYSNSISINIAKSLVNIAAKGNYENSLIDTCCGVGTILLEAAFAGYNIEGFDINWKVCRNARGNLAHFGFETTVYRADIKDIDKRYDAAIIDLPYNLLSCASEDDVVHIITSAGELSDRLVIVSIADIASVIENAGFQITDQCSVGKRGKTSFERKVWVCERGVIENTEQ